MNKIVKPKNVFNVKKEYAGKSKFLGVRNLCMANQD